MYGKENIYIIDDDIYGEVNIKKKYISSMIYMFNRFEGTGEINRSQYIERPRGGIALPTIWYYQ